MRVLIAPDKFKGTFTAREVAQAMAQGVQRVWPDAEIVLIPMADGGDGTLAALRAVGWEIRSTQGFDAHRRPKEVAYAVNGDEAVVELSAVCGLAPLSPRERDPWCTTSYGLGHLAASLAGEFSVTLTLGGSASIDGGAGFLQGLGVPVLDGRGNSIESGLRGVRRAVEIGDVPEWCAGFVTLCDVLVPLLGDNGAVRLFGAQKGLVDERGAESVLVHWADVLNARFGSPATAQPGAGAAGGVGAASSALGGTLLSGARVLAEWLGVPELAGAADLVITGEGRIDAGTVEGKAPWVVASLATSAEVLFIAGGCQNPMRITSHGYRIRCGDGRNVDLWGIQALVAEAVAEI